jgi:hypothetical protein
MYQYSLQPIMGLTEVFPMRSFSFYISIFEILLRKVMASISYMNVKRYCQVRNGRNDFPQ